MPPTPARVKGLAQALAASLRQSSPVAGLNPTRLLNAANDLSIEADQIVANGSLGDAAADLKSLVQELSGFTASLQLQLPSDGVPPTLLPAWTLNCMAVCLTLDMFLTLLQHKELKLADDEWTRLLAALAVPLKLAPRLLGSLAAAAQRDAEVRAHMLVFLEKSVQPLQRLLDMLYAMEPAAVPRRVAALLQATHLQPRAVCEWMGAIAAAALAHMRAAGSFKPPAFLAHVLRTILATDFFTSTKAVVEQEPSAQSTVVDFAERALALPLEQQAALADDGTRCATLRDLAEAAAADCLAYGRRRCASLLPAAANLAACPELQAQRGSPGPGSLLIACLELQAVLLHDSIAQQPGPQRLKLSGDELRAMGCQGGLPLLCTLAAEVAAAAPGSGRSGSSGSGGTGGGFGPWCWKEVAGDWKVCLHRWLLVLGPLVSRGVEERMCDLQICLASWRAAEALLRMLPTLPAQPATQLRTGHWRTAAEDVAAVGGLQALRDGGEVQGHDGPMLAVAALHVAPRLLEAAVPVEAARGPEAGQAAFELLSTICRAVHHVAPALRPGSSVGAGTESCLLVRNDITDWMRLLDGAAAQVLRTSRQVLPALSGDEQRTAADRRLECALLLYLSALEALLRLQPPVRDGEGAAKRCDLWQDLLDTPSLQPLWRALLSSAGPAACGTDVAWVLAEGMALSINDFAHEQIQSGRPLSLEEMAPFEAPLVVLGAALQLVSGPQLERRLAHQPSLLSMLCRTTSGLQNAINMDWQRGTLMFLGQRPNAALAALWQVTAALAPHLPGLQGPQRAALLQALPPLPSRGSPIEVRALTVAMDTLTLAAKAAEAEQQQQQQQQQPAAEPGDPDQTAALALRRAHALAQRRSCGNPRCASLAGSSEAAARGSRCSACHLLRFCGQACNKQEWRWHKLACRALREAGA